MRHENLLSTFIAHFIEFIAIMEEFTKEVITPVMERDALKPRYASTGRG
jgi:hypothetical protein